MLPKRTIRIVLILLIVMINVGCDQVSKKIIRNNIITNESIGFLGDHLTVTRVENSGAFLSMGDSLPSSTKNILLSAIPLLALVIAFIYILSQKTLPRPTLLGLCFIIGGGTGNLFDRIVYGSVTDFLHIDAGIFRTGIFNMADVSIVIGTLIIFFSWLFKKKTTSQESAET